MSACIPQVIYTIITFKGNKVKKGGNDIDDEDENDGDDDDDGEEDGEDGVLMLMKTVRLMTIMVLTVRLYMFALCLSVAKITAQSTAVK